MKKAILLLLLAPVILLNISGCWFIIGGAAGAAGAYAVSKDTIQGETDKPYDGLWNSAIDVGKIRGTIKRQDYSSGKIEILTSDANHIWINLERLTPATTRVKVSCRKHHFSNLDLAQELYMKIIEEAK